MRYSISATRTACESCAPASWLEHAVEIGLTLLPNSGQRVSLISPSEARSNVGISKKTDRSHL